MQREYEAALQALENTAVEHLSWLKHVHTALLFRRTIDAVPAPVPQTLTNWVEAPECPSATSERLAAFTRLSKAHQAMLLGCERLANCREEIDPAVYQSFMSGVEVFAHELRQVENMLRQSMAETDPLTGVQNRLGMMRDLNREWQRSIRTGQPCCVALIDLDHFKKVNDTYGHIAGDKVLSAAARFFLRQLRPYDRVYRYGGEEFLFVLPNTELDMAERVLNRLRGLMARLPVRLKEGPVLHVTASIGIAEMASPEDTPNLVIARADRAVYAAKNAGRNRVCVDVTDAEIELSQLPSSALSAPEARGLSGGQAVGS